MSYTGLAAKPANLQILIDINACTIAHITCLLHAVTTHVTSSSNPVRISPKRFLLSSNDSNFPFKLGYFLQPSVLKIVRLLDLRYGKIPLTAKAFFKEFETYVYLALPYLTQDLKTAMEFEIPGRA